MHVPENSPLTEEELHQYLDTFCEAVLANYSKALRSGAIGEEHLAQGDHTLAKCCVALTAQGCVPLEQKGRSLYANLRHFI